MMPVYRFRGFASGSAVALGAAQGTASGSASVPAWGEAHAGSVTVSITRSDWRVAPETIAFEVTGYSGFETPAPSGTFDVRFHDFAFLWDFGDPGSTFAVPQRLPVPHRNANVAYGPEVAHTYGPGTYTASVLVVELSSGRTAYWEQQIAVADPDVFFAGKTITVNPDGGASHTTLYAALDAVRAQGDVRRIQLARGRTYSLTTTYDWRTGTFPNVYVAAAPGPGDRPILSWDQPVTNYTSVFDRLGQMNRAAGARVDMVFAGIRFRGAWNPTTESGMDNGMRWFFVQRNDPPTPTSGPPNYLLLHDCEFRGVSLSFQAGPPTMSLFLSGCSFRDWQDYGAGLLGLDRLVLIGTEIRQNPLAIGGGTKDFRHNMHGPIRIGAVRHMIVDGCDLFSNNGWFPNTFGYRTIQAAFRFSQEGLEGDRLNMQRTILEGGFEVFGASNASGAPTVANSNARIEKCYFLGSHMTRAMFVTQHGGFTIRNNVMVHPNVSARLGLFGISSWFRIRSPGVTSATTLARILLEHNTLVSLQGGIAPVPIVVYDSTPFQQAGLIVRNNVVHQPNATIPQTDYAPLDSTVVITPLCIGYQRRLEVFTGTIGSAVPPGGFIDVPYAGGDFGNGTQASYQAANAAHTFSLTGPVTFALNPSSVRITNTGTATWAVGQGWTLELERNAANLPPLTTAFATPPATGALYAPLVGSDALGLAGEADIRDDFFGDIRPQMSSYGALEAAD